MNLHNSLSSTSDCKVVRIRSTGATFVSGLSSSYDDQSYPEELEGVLTASELHEVISKLNNQIVSFWPCNTCMFFGIVCAPLTCGGSFLCPGYCVSHAEEAAESSLRNSSLKSKYFDRGITFRLVRRWCNSWVEVSFPLDLAKGCKEVERMEAPGVVNFQSNKPFKTL